MKDKEKRSGIWDKRDIHVLKQIWALRTKLNRTCSNIYLTY